MSDSITAMATSNKLHVVMFPWLAFGHIIPFFELSKFIAQKGHKVSFISTNRNIDRLPKIPSNLNPLITLVKLSLPRINGLPENAEATIDIHTDDAQYLKKAFDGLEPELAQFLENSSPDWVIYDFAPHWLPPIAARLGISRAFFSIFNAWFVGFLSPSTEVMINGSDERTTPEDFTVPAEWVPFPNKVAFRFHEINRFLGSSRENASGYSDWYRIGSAIIGSDVIIIRHCMEFEPDWLNLLEKLHHRPVVPVGLMPPSAHGSGDDKNETWLSICEWLDKHEKESVVYVALGSELTLSQLELTELALGLELSGLPFFWAFRKPPALTESDSVELPDGFVERIKGRGLVWTSWAPQLRILSHDSVGGFLTHCGWSSMIEGLVFGRPLIMLPFWLDQGLNARILADKKVGIEVPRNERDGSFTKDTVAKSVSLALSKSGNVSYRDEAKEMSAIFGDGDLHYKYLDDFIQHLEHNTKYAEA